MTYTYIKTDGSKRYITSKKPLSLKRLQALVGGSIEFATRRISGLNITFCINEEGLLHKLERNQMYPEFVGDIILGQLTQKSSGTEFEGGILI